MLYGSRDPPEPTTQLLIRVFQLYALNDSARWGGPLRPRPHPHSPRSRRGCVALALSFHYWSFDSPITNLPISASVGLLACGGKLVMIFRIIWNAPGGAPGSGSSIGASPLHSRSAVIARLV